ncbi:MAG: FAD-dependent oxidoreductase, partial [Myxococcales bacterium]|nr:FAD-dependent oxidoreductase [Myxococcales bacterium]
MEKPFRPLPLPTLARWIFRDLDESDTILGIPRANLKIPSKKLAMTRMGKTFASPLGVAAGPHTQLAQNIIAAWLVGGRFIELKTVQVLDTIHVSKPCIDSEDATFNCEWSQELTLTESFDEYLKAWVILHAMAHKLGLDSPGVFFSMSVGYNLEGILSPTVQNFLDQMRDASKALPAAIDAVAEFYPAVRELKIPIQLSNQITLSTMHGCPPSEIEKIASYLIAERGVHTLVKLNPTLIGPERLRNILNDQCGFDIEVPDIAFEHDPKFEDAMAMIRNLKALAAGRENTFGIKLSNTLEVVNGRPVFPANEKMMYMSGRSLHPVTLTLAHLVTEEMDGDISISFCGGADAENYTDLIADGLGPVTVCSDLLKPGGYARLNQFLDNLEAELDRAGVSCVDELPAKIASEHADGARGNLTRHVGKVLSQKRFLSRAKAMDTKGKWKLGFFDCSRAPCQDACPTHQDVPEYLRLVAAGKPSEALDVILRTNPLPCVTGNVCTHPCMDRCVRNHGDEPVQIRAIKRFAAEHGKTTPQNLPPKGDHKVAIIGAGPAGLSAANYLAELGVQVTVFEAHADLGGMVASAIPAYRLTKEALKADLDRIAAKGVEVKFGQKLGGSLTIESLKKSGFEAIFLGIGAAAGKKLGIEGENAAGVFDALDFLDKAKKGEAIDLGDKVLVIGAGNSAMDAARTAKRLVKDGLVDIVYRRTRAQMPADPEEIEACVEEGIGLKTLLAPKSIKVEGGKAVALV